MHTQSRLLIGLALVGALGALSGGVTSQAASAPAQSTLTGAVSLAQHPGKLLAGNCFQCHGTNGKNGAFDSIAGENAAEMFKELKEFQTKPDIDEAIMRAHALSYTDAQLRLIADYFANVR